MNDNVWVATKCGDLGLRVSECPRDRETSGKNPQRSRQVVLLIFAKFFFIICNYLVCRRSVVYLATTLSDPQCLRVLTRLVIHTKRVSFLALLAGQHRSGVTNIRHITNVLDDEDDNGTGATLVLELIRRRVVNPREESLLSFLKAVDDSLLRIRREAWLLDHEQMEAVPQEVCALRSTMAIINTKV